MKLFLSLFFVFQIIVNYSQELSFNESNSFYEYSKIIENNDSLISGKFKNRLFELNYKNITISDKNISAEGITSHLVAGFATVEIKYVVKISFKETKYKITLTNFVLTDKNGSNPIENMGAFKSKWIKIINEKIPDIIGSILSSNSDDW